MTIDERIEALTMNLELASRQQETHSQQIEMLITAGEKAGERIEAVTMNLELVTRDIETLRDLAAKTVRTSAA